MLKSILTGAALALALGATVPAAAVAGAPLEAYGRLPSMQSVSISPDGTMIAFIVTAEAGNDRFIVVQPLGGTPIQTASIGFRKVRDVLWSGNDHVAIITSTTDVVPGVFYSGEMFQGASLNIRTGEMVQLPSKSLDSIVNVLMGGVQPGTVGGRPVILTSLFVSDGKGYQYKDSRLDLYAIDLTTGRAVRQQMGDSATYGYLARPDGTPLAKVSFRGRETISEWTLAVRKGGAWKDVYTVNAAIDTPDMFGITRDGKTLVVDSWDETEKTWRLTALDIETEKLAGYIGPATPTGVITDEAGVVLGYARQNAAWDYDFVEPKLKAAWPMVRGVFKGKQVTLASWTPDFGKLVVYVDGGTEAGAYFLVDLTAKKVNPLGKAYPKIASTDVGEVRAVKYAAADGLEISGYLTLPPGRADAKGLPLVVLPHGGPQARDYAGFDWWAQALASRGYAVLQPNFRGSGGLGHSFTTAGYGEWGRKMQTDLSDGVTYLAQQGVIDPKRVCIMGASYGGYAALAGVTLQKDIYRCSVSVAGVADLRAFLDDRVMRGGSKSTTIRYWNRFMGVERYDDPKLDVISPVQQAAKASAPVLLIHGKDDRVVEFEQSTLMLKALKSAGKPVEMVTLRNEDHWLSNAETRQEMLTWAVTFLEKHNPPN